MITFVLFKWRPEFLNAPLYTAAHVNRLAGQIKDNYQRPCRVICYTDDPFGIWAPTQTRPLWPDTKPLEEAGIQQWKWTHARVFRLFSAEEGRALGGGRICLMDLDMTITGDMTEALDRSEPIVLTRSKGRQTYNPRVVAFDAGARTQLWDEFRGDASRPFIKAADEPLVSSGWLGACLGPDEAVFPDDAPWVHGRSHMRDAA